MAIDGTSVAVLHPVDQGRLHTLAAIHQHGIGRGQAEQGGLPRAKRHGKMLRHIVGDTEAAGIIRDEIHADGLCQTHRHQVPGFLDTQPHRARTVEFLGVVGRLPLAEACALIDHEGRIQYAGRGGEAIVERGQINEGLEGGAGLPGGLGHPVELAVLEAPAAAEGQHAACVRIHGDEAAFDIRNLPQGEGGCRIVLAVVVLGDGFDEDHITRRQNIRRFLHAAAQSLLFVPFPCPGQFSQGDLAERAVFEADLYLFVLGNQDKSLAPAGKRRFRRLERAKSIAPAGDDLDLSERPAPTMAAVVMHQSPMQGLVREALQLRVKGGADGEPAFIEAVLAEPADQPAPDFLGEIIRLGDFRDRPLVGRERIFLRACGVFGRDEAVFLHLADHPVPPGHGSGMVADRMIVVRGFGQCGQIG